MRFLNPSILWFLPLCALPVVLHLLFSARPARIEFSSVFLLRAARKSRRRLTRLLKTLILLLRCLAVFALVWAFSRPVAEWGPLGRSSEFAAGAGRPLSLVVLADRSYSMSASFGGVTRCAFAAQAAGRILGGLGEKDEAALVFFDETAEGGADWTSDFGALSKTIAASRPGYRATDYRKAIEKAYALLASRPAGREKAALFLSDSAQNGFADFPGDISALPAYDSRVRLMGFSFSRSPNSWMRGVSAREGAGGALVLSAYSGGEGAAAAGARLLLSAPAAQGSGPGTGTFVGRFRNGVAVFDVRTPGADPAGRAEVAAADALDADNAAYFAFQWAGRTEARVLVLYGGQRALKPGGGAYFIKKFFEAEAVRALSGAARADVAQYSDVERIRLGDYGALILDGPPPDARSAKLIKDYLSAGGGVFLIAVGGGGEGAGRAEGGFQEAFGLKAGGFLDGRFSPAPALNRAFFGGEDFSGFDLSRISCRRILATGGTAGFETPWHFKDEAGASHPALLYRRSGRGALLVWASSFDIGFADLAAKPAFAPFMAFSLRKLFGLDAPAVRSAPVGGVYEGRLAGRERISVSVAAPDGSKAYVFAEDGVFRYGLTSRPGLYRWSAPPEAGVFAVNLDHARGESALLVSKKPPWRVLRSEEPVADFKNALYGVEISRFLLLAALVFFLAEFLLSRKAL